MYHYENRLPSTRRGGRFQRLAERSTGGHRTTSESTEGVNTLSAHRLDNQSGLFPNLKGDGSTTRSKVRQTQRNLGGAVNQRLTIVAHAKGVQLAGEAVGARSSLAKVAVGNHSEATNTSFNRASETKTRDNARTVVEINQLGTLEPRYRDWETGFQSRCFPVTIGVIVS